MIQEMTEGINGLGVYPKNMLRKMNIYGGVVFSQRVLLSLVATGMSREKAYRLVQRNAHEAWNKEGGNFKANLELDQEVMKQLSIEHLAKCFDTDIHQANLEVIWQRLEI